MNDRYREYPRATWRRRLLVSVLAVVTAVVVVLTILYPPGGVDRTRPLPPDVARCEGAQQEECVGGRAAVLLAPAPAALPAPAAAASR